jgi:hypothetical protein
LQRERIGAVRRGYENIHNDCGFGIADCGLKSKKQKAEDNIFAFCLLLFS